MKNYFAGRQPSHYQINPIVKAFIISEGFFWSGYNFIYPLLSVFIIKEIIGGTIELAAAAVSVYMISRVFSELISGRFLEGRRDKIRAEISILGIVIVAFAYFSCAFINSIFMVYTLLFVIGVGLGAASPAKYALFSQHLNPQKATSEWSFYDAVSFIGMALSAALGGFVAQEYGFKLLFYVASIFIVLSAVPYFIVLKSIPKN